MDPYAALTLFVSITAVIGFFITLFVLRMGRQSYHYTFAMIQLLVIVFLFGYVLDVYSPSLEDKLLWNNIEYAANMFISLLTLVFAMQYTRVSQRTITRTMVALTMATLVLLAVLVTNPYHHLMYVSVTLADDPLRSFDAIHAPLFYGIMVAIFGEMILACLFIWRSLRKTPKMLRSHSRMILFALILPTVIGMFMVPFWHDIPPTIIEISGIFLSSVLIFYGMLYRDIFRAVPLNIDAIVRSSKDGMMVLDDLHRPLYMNPSAALLLGLGNADRSNVPVTELMPTIPVDLMDGGCVSSSALRSEVELVPDRFFDLSVNQVKGVRGDEVGHVMIVHDVTDTKATAERATRALKKMGIMNRISRHDLANEIMVLNGNIVLAEMEDRMTQERAEKLKKVLDSMGHQIAFMREYQELGESEPKWQDVMSVFSSVVLSAGLMDIAVTSSVDVEIYADPMFEKVLFNLLDNSLRHGGHITRIDLSQRPEGEGIVLTYTDDGDGIPDDKRSDLFQGSFGGAHGYGMFLSREILALTGILISEDGVKGQGVRFNLFVPKGRFRRRTGE